MTRQGGCVSVDLNTQIRVQRLIESQGRKESKPGKEVQKSTKYTRQGPKQGINEKRKQRRRGILKKDSRMTHSYFTIIEVKYF